MKKPIFFILAVLFSTSLFSQAQFGIQLAYDQSRLEVEPGALTNTLYNDVTGEGGNGFSLGVLARFALTKHIGLSFQPAISFQESTFNYETVANEIEAFKQENVLLQLPVQIEYHLTRLPLNPYLIGGGKWFYDLASDRVVGADLLKDTAWAIYGGLGLEFAFDKFLFHPELVYAYNPNNMWNVESGITTNVVESARLDVVSLRLNFSGAMSR